MLKDFKGKKEQLLLLAPLFLFILSPVIQLIQVFFLPPTAGEGYAMVRYQMLIQLLSIFATLCFFAYLCYKILSHSTALISICSYIEKNRYLCFFALLCIWIFVATAWNGFTNEALYGDQYCAESIFSYFLYFGVYFLYASLVRSVPASAVLIHMILFVGDILALHTAIGIFLYPIPGALTDEGITSVFFNSNHYGYFLIFPILLSAVLMTSAAGRGRKVFYAFSLMLNAFVLTINDTLGCMIACLIGIIGARIVTLRRENGFCFRYLLPLILFLAMSICANFAIASPTLVANGASLISDVGKIWNQENAGSAGSGRWELWTKSISLIIERPLIGYGIDGCQYELAPVGQRPHNEYLQYALFFGIPALLFYLTGLFQTFRAIRKGWKDLNESAYAYSFACTVAACGYLISAFFGNTKFYTSPFFFLILGLGLGISEQQNGICRS